MTKISRKGIPFVVFTEEQLQRMKNLYEADNSLKDISAIYGIDATTVATRLRAMGVEIRKSHRPRCLSEDKLAEVHELKQKNVTWEALGEIFSVNDKTLRGAYYEYLKRNNITRQ